MEKDFHPETSSGGMERFSTLPLEVALLSMIDTKIDSYEIPLVFVMTEFYLIFSPFNAWPPSFSTT